MTWARLCEHGEVKAHKGSGYLLNGYWQVVDSGVDCPGGSVLPDDTLVIVKEDGEWPTSVVDLLRLALADRQSRGFTNQVVREVLDALHEVAFIESSGDPGGFNGL